MSNKVIKIYTTLGSPGTVETTATNKLELDAVLLERGIDTTGMKLLIGETRNELSEDTALLPEGDFKLYLVPSRTKSGASEMQELELLRILLKLKAKLIDLKKDIEKEVKEKQEEEKESISHEAFEIGSEGDIPEELPEEVKTILKKISEVKNRFEAKKSLDEDEKKAKEEILSMMGSAQPESDWD